MNVRVALAAAAALQTLTWVGAATASPTFPPAIKQFVGSAMAPPCTICHNNPSGGTGTATMRFAMYMRSRGLMPLDLNSLTVALMAAQAEGHISNSDGIKDFDALRAGEDPNNPKGVATGEAPPSFGCGAHIASSSDAGNGKAMLLVGAAAIGVSRRRWRSSRSVTAARGGSPR
jgi:hypothetical protein